MIAAAATAGAQGEGWGKSVTEDDRPGNPESLDSAHRALAKREREIELSLQALREKDRMLATLLSNLDGMVYRSRGDDRSTMEFMSEGCYGLTGYHPTELLLSASLSYDQLTHPDDRSRVCDEIRSSITQARRFLIEYRIQHRDGRTKWVWERGVGIAGSDGKAAVIEGFVEDVTERKLATQALQEAERGFRSIFENATEGIFQTSPDGEYLIVNPAMARIYGYDTPAGLIAHVGNIHRQHYIDPTRRAEFMRLMQKHGVVTNFVSEIRRPSGDEIWISENARAVLDSAGNLMFYEGTVEDVTESKLSQEKLVYLANHDPVTNLPNRLLMNDRLRQMMLSAQRNNSVVAVVLLDLDHFKLINDTFGHNRGDQLLQTVAHRMQECLRDADTVARLGGDEFVLLLSGEGRGEAMSQVTQRVLESVSQPWHVEERELSVSCSMGVSVFPRDGRDVQTLLKNADTAMYQAKELGRNNFQFYSPEMNVAILGRLEMQTILRQAVENDRFVLMYQPKIDLVSGRFAGMEALLRIDDGRDGLLQPQSFIRLAEETGLMVKIGEWVMREACAFSKALLDRGLPPMRVAINLSARQLTRYDLLRAVERTLRETGLPPQLLEFELTESMVMQGPPDVVDTLTRLHALGVQLSIDDFGTGYSSVSYLKRFPVTSLKIDRSFVGDLDGGEHSASIVKAIISLGHSLGMQLIAEGVETREQMSFLVENSCDAMQGFLISRPLAADEFIRLLERSHASPGAPGLLRQESVSYGDHPPLQLMAHVSGT